MKPIHVVGIHFGNHASPRKIHDTDHDAILQKHVLYIYVLLGVSGSDLQDVMNPHEGLAGIPHELPARNQGYSYRFLHERRWRG